MNLNFIKKNAFPIIAVLVFAVLTFISWDYCFFWDTIQQTTKEAHWFYLQNFSKFLMPQYTSGSEIVGTGCHPPLMGIMTALLWKAFGYKLYVLHCFAFLWAVILIYNLQLLVSKYVEKQYQGWLLLILVLEPTILSQFVIASPDFILFSAFVWAFRSILEKQKLSTAIAIFFVCCINMRGSFVGIALFIGTIYFNYLETKKLGLKQSIISISPFIPTILILLVYYIYYILNKGWFFHIIHNNDYHAPPQNALIIIKHIFEFILRSAENGRFLIWIMAFILISNMLRIRAKFTDIQKISLVIFSIIIGIYIVLVFATQLAFSSRYFSAYFLILTLITFSSLTLIKNRILIRFLIILSIIAELSGNLWCYPEKIAKPWDCSLMHLPYYKLREECFNYIDSQKIPYSEIGGGFCLYGNKRFIDLLGKDVRISEKKNKQYYLYSNISNEEDGFIVEIHDKTKWEKIKSFKKGFVWIDLYKNKKASY